MKVFEDAGYKDYADYVQGVAHGYVSDQETESDIDNSSSDEDCFPSQPQTYPNLKILSSNSSIKQMIPLEYPPCKLQDDLDLPNSEL